MKKLMLVLVASACCTALTMKVSAQQADQATTDAVIAMTKAQWAAEIKDPTNVSGQMKDASDDYTEFNGDYATRLDGKAMNSHLAEATAKASGKTIAAEMANPKVQVYNGNVAILTYNYVGVIQDKDGTDSRKIDARFCEKRRQMDASPRKLWDGSAAKTIRLWRSENAAACAHFALLAAPHLPET